MKLNKILLILALIFFVTTIQQCAIEKNKNSKIAFEKDLKKDSLSIKDLMANLEIRKPNFTDTIAFSTFNKRYKLRKNLIKKLQLQKVDSGAKKYYAQYGIDFSNNFNSIVILSMKNQEVFNYLINYDDNGKMIDKLLISSDIEGGIRQSEISGNKIVILEAYAAGKQAIIEDLGALVLNNQGKFESQE